jgi:hypothetical protein
MPPDEAYPQRLGIEENAALASDHELRDAVEEELRQLLDEVLYTEKTHFAAAERLRQSHRRLGLMSMAMSTVAAATIVAERSPTVAALCALAAAISSGVLTFTKPANTAEQHLSAAHRLASLRVQLRHALKLDQLTYPVETMVGRIEELSAQKAEIDQGAPGTEQKDYKTASGKIRAGTYERDEGPLPRPK